MRSALPALSIALLIGASAGIGFVLFDLDRRISHSEVLIQESTMSLSPRHYAKVTKDGLARVYFRQHDETPEAFFARVKRAYTGQEEPGGVVYVCTTLVDCDNGIEEIQVCTPCEDPQSEACARLLAEDVAAACREFHCSNCP